MKLLRLYSIHYDLHMINYKQRMIAKSARNVVYFMQDSMQKTVCINDVYLFSTTCMPQTIGNPTASANLYYVN